MIKKLLAKEFTLFNFRISGANIVSHPLFSGSAAMVFGGNLVNVLAFLYHSIIGRLLNDPAPYGEIAGTLSLLGLVAAGFSFLGFVIIKFISSADDKEKEAIYSWFVKKTLLMGLVVVGVCFLLAVQLSNFLRIDIRIAFLIGPILFVFLLNFVYKSFLQGLLEFRKMTYVAAVDLFGRLVIGVLLVYLGYSAFGAVVGILLGAVASTILGWTYLRNFKVRNVAKFSKVGHVLKYAVPVFIATLTTTSLFSTDVVLAKRYLDPYDAGIYASLSTLGRIIFFSTAPVASVMFPIIAKRHAKGEGYKKIFLGSLIMTLAIAFSVTAIYIFIPEIPVSILYGPSFLAGVDHLYLFGIFMTLFAMGNLIITFYLSLDNTKVSIIPLFFAIFQILGIVIYHDSILSIIKVSILTASLMLISLLIFFGYSKLKT